MLLRRIEKLSPVDGQFCLEKIEWHYRKSCKFSNAFDNGGSGNFDLADEVRLSLEQELS